jgi:hypothetical protein
MLPQKRSVTLGKSCPTSADSSMLLGSATSRRRHPRAIDVPGGGTGADEHCAYYETPVVTAGLLAARPPGVTVSSMTRPAIRCHALA